MMPDAGLVACASLWSLAPSCVHSKTKHRGSPGFANHILNRISYFMGSVWIWLSVFKRTCHPENHTCTEPALGKTEDVKFFSSFIFSFILFSRSTLSFSPILFPPELPDHIWSCGLLSHPSLHIFYASKKYFHILGTKLCCIDGTKENSGASDNEEHGGGWGMRKRGAARQFYFFVTPK